MPFQRRWSQWPKRVANELNGVSGVAGVGGAAVGIASWSLLAGTAAFALSGAGAIITVGAFGYALVKAIPPAIRRPEDLVGKTITLNELANISPRIKALSIIGLTMAGKTTLKDRLSFAVSTATRTQETSAYIASLQTTPITYFAILDGGGEKYAQQFKLSEICDCLCIVIDHSASDADTAVDSRRLLDHEAFLMQVRHYLDESAVGPKLWIQLLINKCDLWSRASSADKAALDKFYTDELARWRQGSRAKVIDLRLHSNDNPADIAYFVNLLKKTALS